MLTISHHSLTGFTPYNTTHFTCFVLLLKSTYSFLFSVAPIMPKRNYCAKPTPTTKKLRQQQTSMTTFFRPNGDARYSDDDSNDHDSNENDQNDYRLFVDLDGVLVDFEVGVRRLFPRHPVDRPVSDIPLQSMWAAVTRTKDFYNRLPWTSDGKELWRHVTATTNGDGRKKLLPEILTGVPRNKAAREQKYNWCKRELPLATSTLDNDDDNVVRVRHFDMAGPKRSHESVDGAHQRRTRSASTINVITCWSANKHCESGPNRILIDDREKLGVEWEKRGGIFVHHTDTESTLKKLQRLGIETTSLTNHDDDTVNAQHEHSAKESP